MMGSTSLQHYSRGVYFGKISPIPVITVCYWLVMMVTGTDLINASLLTCSIMFGLMSIESAGGIRTAPGLLNLVLILKFVLIAVLLKACTLQPTDSNMQAPRTTSYAMAIGFFAVYLGSWLYNVSPKPGGLVKEVTDARLYLALAIVFSIACLGSAFLILLFQTSYETKLVGGFWGIAHSFEGAASFCVVPAMYYAWSAGSRRFLSHPLVLVILFAELAWGIASTTKQAIMEPLLCYLSVGFIRYGIRSRAVWGILAGSGFVYVSVIYPYSQYVRNHGGRDGTLAERLEVIQEVFLNVTTDTDFRDSVDSQILGDGGYLGTGSLSPVSRLAMIGEADLLIAATDGTQSYTEWQTIKNGLQLMMPRFLMPDKPTSGGGNFLGHITGELAQDDMDTQISYGFMANFFNAFGLNGVFFGTTILIAVLYYSFSLWFEKPKLTSLPFGSSLWYILIAMLWEHGLVEFPVGNILAGMVSFGPLLILIYLSKSWAWVFSKKGPRSHSPLNWHLLKS